MPTPKKGTRFGGSASNQKHILSNQASALIQHGAIKTTDAKAKVLRPYVEKLITKAKGGSLTERREVAKHLPNKDVVSYLFNELAPKFENRPGGYTRIVKLENRAGDNAAMSQISLVLEETVTSEANRATRAAASKKQAEEAQAEEAPAEETQAEETQVEEAPADEAPAEEAKAEETEEK